MTDSDDQAAKRADGLVEVGLDLHDGPLQDAAFLVGHARALRDDLTTGRPAEELVVAVEMLHDVTVELERRLRTLAEALVSQRKIDPPFRSEIEATITRFSRRSGLAVELTGSGPLDELPRDVRHTLVHVVAEALENVRRHSDASHVWIDARTADGAVRLEVRDDGAGFSPAEHGGRLGLNGMAERMRRHGGRLEIDSSPGEGTSVQALLPA
ncbi:MAG TPA: ATP-binding protein [Gaiellaceae bacterium]|nr:ATP-binding protein [Gaiellaceae bacterium]